MNDVKIKFCGIKNPEDIEAVNRIRPEYIGFVFWEKSRRYVTSEAAAELKAKLDLAIQAVGVFVDEDPGVVEKLLGEGLIDLAQLHGQETDEMIRQLQATLESLAADIRKVDQSYTSYKARNYLSFQASHKRFLDRIAPAQAFGTALGLLLAAFVMVLLRNLTKRDGKV